MEQWYLATGMLCLLSLGASEEKDNNNLFGKPLYSFSTKRLVRTAEMASYPMILKHARDEQKQEGSVSSQLQQGFSCAVDSKNGLAAWRLSLAYHKQQEDWKYNAKSFGWTMFGLAAGAATMWVYQSIASKSQSSTKKE